MVLEVMVIPRVNQKMLTKYLLWENMLVVVVLVVDLFVLLTHWLFLLLYYFDWMVDHPLLSVLSYFLSVLTLLVSLQYIYDHSSDNKSSKESNIFLLKYDLIKVYSGIVLKEILRDELSIKPRKSI